MKETPNRMNRLHNTTNSNQGMFKKVLCVCSAGILRSPTAAVVLSQKPFNFNTRAAGLVASYALVVVDEILLAWADEIVCMESAHKGWLLQMLEEFGLEDKPVICLNIPDDFKYRNPDLMDLIKTRYEEVTKDESKTD